jgi:hypothetical protein
VHDDLEMAIVRQVDGNKQVAGLPLLDTQVDGDKHVVGLSSLDPQDNEDTPKSVIMDTGPTHTLDDSADTKARRMEFPQSDSPFHQRLMMRPWPIWYSNHLLPQQHPTLVWL